MQKQTSQFSYKCALSTFKKSKLNVMSGTGIALLEFCSGLCPLLFVQVIEIGGIWAV